MSRQPKLFLQLRDSPGSRCPLSGDGVVAGSSLDADIQIDNPYVSGRHARFSQNESGGIIIEDLKSTNGTWVDGERIQQAVAGPSSSIRLGQVYIEIKTDESGEQRSSAATRPESELKSAPETIERINRLSPAEQEYKSKIFDIFSERMDRAKMIGESEEKLHARIEKVLSGLFLEISHAPDVRNEAVRKSILSDVLGLGPLETLLEDDTVTEIMVNSESQVFIERGGRVTRTDAAFKNRNHLIHVIERIVSPLGRRIDESSPLVDARLPDGSRVNAIIPPLAIDGPSLTIRKFGKKRYTTDDLIAWGSLTAQMADFLNVCVENRRNILISGGTGSGKTTLLNILSSFIPEGERIVTIEDSAELRLDHENLVRLEARPPNMEGRGTVSIRDLVINSLRMRPDRIVVGECRGGEALDMVQAMNTGHDGSITTAHANSPRDALRRVEVMCLMSGMDLPIMAIREQVASALNMIVQISRFKDGTRKVVCISEITGMEGDKITMQDIFRYEQEGYTEGGTVMGEHRATGNIPSWVEKIRASGVRIDLELFKTGAR